MASSDGSCRRRWGEKVMSAPDVLPSKAAQEANHQRPPAQRGCWRDQWQAKRKHGCPALEGSLGKGKKSDHRPYGKLCISEAIGS